MNLTRDLEDGNKILLSIDDKYYIEILSISKGYFENENLLKTVSLFMQDDFNFSGYMENVKDIKELSFEFDINDPLYFCLNRLLGNSTELIIDDDDTREQMKKYMIIKKENNTIKIIFINKNLNCLEYDKFGVFIKNIFEDGRSKIKFTDIKPKLIKFFKEAKIALLEDYHQVTIDEHIARMECSEKKVLSLKK